MRLDPPMIASGRAVVETAERLARERLAPRAARYDRAQNPVESWRDLWHEGVSKAVQVVGGLGAYRDYPVERAFRDLRTCTLMPPTVDRMLEALGKSALGLDAAMFNVAGADRP